MRVASGCVAAAWLTVSAGTVGLSQTQARDGRSPAPLSTGAGEKLLLLELSLASMAQGTGEPRADVDGRKPGIGDVISPLDEFCFF